LFVEIFIVLLYVYQILADKYANIQILTFAAFAVCGVLQTLLFNLAEKLRNSVHEFGLGFNCGH